MRVTATRRGPGPVVDDAARRLAAAGVASPAVDAALLAAHVLGTDVAALRRDRAPRFGPGEHRRFERLVEERARRVPLQHLTGEAAFRDLVLRCRPGVFVPRPETELVAGAAIERLRRGADRPRVAVEPGTGTGAIALSLAVEVPGVHVVATDTDPVAVSLARANLARVRRGQGGAAGLAPGSRCTILPGDILDPVDRALRGRVDVLVSNPPYLTADELRRCEPEVRDHDPVGALVGGRRGSEMTDRLVGRAPPWLAPGGWLVLEVSEVRVGAAVQAARRAGLSDVEVLDDLTGRERVLVARRHP